MPKSAKSPVIASTDSKALHSSSRRSTHKNSFKEQEQRSDAGVESVHSDYDNIEDSSEEDIVLECDKDESSLKHAHLITKKT